MINRRDASKLVFAGSAAALLPLPSLAQSQAERERILGLWKKRLQKEMNRSLARGCAGTFTVLDFQYIPGQGSLEMICVIRLDWPPGFRVRRYAQQGADAETVYQAMKGEALAHFGGAWPNCVAA